MIDGVVLQKNADQVGTVLPELIEAEPPEIQVEVKRIAKGAASDAFQLAVIIMGLIALMGYVAAFWLPKDKLKGDIIEEAVRSSQMIPKLHLESKDLK